MPYLPSPACCSHSPSMLYCCPEGTLAGCSCLLPHFPGARAGPTSTRVVTLEQRRQVVPNFDPQDEVHPSPDPEHQPHPSFDVVLEGQLPFPTARDSARPSGHRPPLYSPHALGWEGGQLTLALEASAEGVMENPSPEGWTLEPVKQRDSVPLSVWAPKGQI